MKTESILLAVVVLLAASGWVTAYTGDGSAEKPYLISTAEDMNEIGTHQEDWDKHFLLVADINLADYTGTEFNIIGYYEYYQSPNNIPFTGVFDGNDHTISKFTYTATDTHQIGIFGYVDDANAIIKDLTLIDPNVNAAGNSDLVGCLIGRLENGTISGCGAEDGSVSGR